MLFFTTRSFSFFNSLKTSFLSNVWSWSINPGLGSAIFLHFCTFSKATSIEILSAKAIKVIAIATERDFPWAQWIKQELPKNKLISLVGGEKVYWSKKLSYSHNESMKIILPLTKMHSLILVKTFFNIDDFMVCFGSSNQLTNISSTCSKSFEFLRLSNSW